MQPTNQPPASRLDDPRIGTKIGKDNPAQAGDVVETVRGGAIRLLALPPRGEGDLWWGHGFTPNTSGLVYPAGDTILATGQPLDLKEWPPALPAIARAKKGDRFRSEIVSHVWTATKDAVANGARFSAELRDQHGLITRVTEQEPEGNWTPLHAEAPATHASRIGKTARDLHDAGDGPREGDEFERCVGTVLLIPAYWVGRDYDLNAFGGGVIGQEDRAFDANSSKCFRLTREGVSEEDFRERWWRKTTMALGGEPLREFMAHNDPTKDWGTIRFGLSQPEAIEEPTPLTASRASFAAELERADPMVTLGDTTALASTWKRGFLRNYRDSVEWGSNPESCGGTFRGADANTLRALFGVEPLKD